MEFNTAKYQELIERAISLKDANIADYNFILKNKDKQCKIYLSLMESQKDEVSTIFQLARNLKEYINFKDQEKIIDLELIEDLRYIMACNIGNAEIALGIVKA